MNKLIEYAKFIGYLDDKDKLLQVINPFPPPNVRLLYLIDILNRDEMNDEVKLSLIEAIIVKDNRVLGDWLYYCNKFDVKYKLPELPL
jgi:hypothetical protein